MKVVSVGILSALLFYVNLYAQSSKVPFLTADEQLKTMKLQEGYSMELVVGDPVVREPAVAVFDGNGRMYVAEFHTYMQDADGSGKFDKISRVSRHEDTNGDGKIDKSTVFIDKLLLPRILLPLRDGQLVVGETNTLDLFLYTDTDGDGVADKKEEFYKGGSRGGNLEHQPSGLIWSLDNWLYTTYNNYRLRYTNGKVEKSKTGHNGGQWGLTQDLLGKPWFVNAGGERGPLNFQIPIVYGSSKINDEFVGKYKEVWPIDNIPDTQGGRGRLRANNTLNHFTATCGQEIFVGDRLPNELIGNLFFSEPVGRLIRRTSVQVRDGLTFLSNPYEEEKGEFIRTKDPNFRVVNMVTAPDGTIYMVDMYRGIIQEGNWVRKGSYLRKVVEEYELQKNIMRGRIWRIRHKDFKPGPQPKMYSETTAQLVKHLDHANGWWRLTAQKLIILRADKSVIPALKAMVEDAKTSLGKIHALWTLEGLGVIDAASIQKAVKDTDPNVRLTAIRAAESSLKTNNDIASAVHSLSKDTDPNVLVQYCLSINQAKLPDAKERIQAVLASSGSEGVKTLAGKIVGKSHRPKVSLLSKADQEFISKGEGIYKSLCFSCHGEDGKGVKSPAGMMAPPFNGNKRITGHPGLSINIVLHGLTGPIEGKNYAGLMVPMKSNGDEWIAAVLSYIRNSFGNEASIITPAMVTAVRKGTSDRKIPWTISELLKSIPQPVKSKSKWKIQTSNNQSQARNMADGKLEPRWDTQSTMKPGMWVSVELPSSTNISGINIDSAASREDYPRGYILYVSDDGKSWRQITKGAGKQPLVEIQFPAVKAKHIKIELTTSSNTKYWSIHEMDIFEKP